MIRGGHIIGLLALGLHLEGSIWWFSSLETGSDLETLRLVARFSVRLFFFAYLVSCLLRARSHRYRIQS